MDDDAQSSTTNKLQVSPGRAQDAEGNDRQEEPTPSSSVYRSQRRQRPALINGAKQLLGHRAAAPTGNHASPSNTNVVAARFKKLDVANATHARLLRSWHVPEAEREEFANGNSIIAQVDLHMCRLRETSKLDFDMHDENDTPITYVHIDASLNYFESIPSAFETCAAGLRSLDLSLNQIRRPHSVAVFAGLTVLKMARNGIEALPDNFVSGCTRLCELDLSCNKLSTLPRLDELVNLRSLNLRGNQFAVLQGVATLRSLESLNLASNMLQDIADLARVQTLCTLDLASNQLDDLLEVRDIILCLPKLEELKLLGNPVSRERNYRMVIYENPSIVKFDSAKVTKGARDQWKQRKLQADMNHIVHETSTHYMRWIEMEARQKQAALDMLRKREQEIENAFIAYRKSMEAELEECIQYIQDLAENPHEYDASFLGSIDGHKQWQAYLDAADAARAKTHEEELLRLRSALEQRVLIKAETDAYAGKLRLLARERPSVWQDIKRKELASRATREDIDDAESASIRDAREAARARLKARANERSDLLAEAALDAHLSLS